MESHMHEAVQLVDSLSDVQAMSLIKELYRNIYRNVNYTEVTENLSAGGPAIDVLKNSNNQVKKSNLGTEDSVLVTRRILLAFAQDEQLAPVLINTWDDIKDNDDLFVETILALGLVVNLTLFLASSDIKYKDGRFSFHKKEVKPEALKTVVEPITELVRKAPGVS